MIGEIPLISGWRLIYRADPLEPGERCSLLKLEMCVNFNRNPTAVVMNFSATLVGKNWRQENMEGFLTSFAGTASSEVMSACQAASRRQQLLRPRGRQKERRLPLRRRPMERGVWSIVLSSHRRWGSIAPLCVTPVGRSSLVGVEDGGQRR